MRTCVLYPAPSIYSGCIISLSKPINTRTSEDLRSGHGTRAFLYCDKDMLEVVPAREELLSAARELVALSASCCGPGGRSKFLQVVSFEACTDLRFNAILQSCLVDLVEEVALKDADTATDTLS